MALLLEQIAEQNITEAVARGEFDDLPGKGKPLHLEDLSFVPEELRMAYKILKNSGFIPPELEWRGNINQLEQALHTSSDKEERKKVIRRLQCLYLRLDASGTRHTNLLVQNEYYEKIISRLSSSSQP